MRNAEKTHTVSCFTKSLHSIFNAPHMGLQYCNIFSFSKWWTCMHFTHVRYKILFSFWSTARLSHKRRCALKASSVFCWGLSKLTQINQQWNFTSGFTDTRGAIVWPHVLVSLFEEGVNWKERAKAAGSL